MPTSVSTPAPPSQKYTPYKHHINTADRLPLAKLSIQNKQPTLPTEITQPIKTKKNFPLQSPKLTHPYSLNVLPSPRDKWSTMTPPPLSYHHWIQGHAHFVCTLLLPEWLRAPRKSTTATTIGDGGSPQGTTELDDESGHNCRMSDEDYRVFVHLVLGLDYGGMGTGSEGHKQCSHSFVDMLLTNYSAIANLHPAIHNKIVDNRQALARALACCPLLLLSSDALTLSIIQRVWGANDTIRQKLGGPRGDLSLIQ